VTGQQAGAGYRAVARCTEKPILKRKASGQAGRELSRSRGVSARLSPELLARLDATAAAWGLNRAATLRRLVELADVQAAPVGVPTMDELIAIASEKARAGNMAAVSFLAARQPDEREAEFHRLLERLGAGSQ